METRRGTQFPKATKAEKSARWPVVMLHFRVAPTGRGTWVKIVCTFGEGEDFWGSAEGSARQILFTFKAFLPNAALMSFC